MVYEELFLFHKEVVKFVKLNTLNQKQSKYFGSSQNAQITKWTNQSSRQEM